MKQTVQAIIDRIADVIGPVTRVLSKPWIGPLNRPRRSYCFPFFSWIFRRYIPSARQQMDCRRCAHRFGVLVSGKTSTRTSGWQDPPASVSGSDEEDGLCVICIR
jgi:hypothetical protein